MPNWTKKQLEDLYAKMSIGEMADHFGVAKSTIYYHLKKHDIGRRSRSDAQRRRTRDKPHQRVGKKHSKGSRANISEGLRTFWESEDGQAARQRISDSRRRVWTEMSPAERKKVVDRMSRAPRAKKGELSKTAQALFDYLKEQGERVVPNVDLTQDQSFDIVLEDRKVAVKIIVIMSASKTVETPHVPESVAGYAVLPYRSKCSGMSRAECQRIHKAILNIAVQDGTM